MWRMKLFPSRKLSDAEFVEQTRKRLKQGRKWAWVGLVVSGGFVVLFICFLVFAIDWVSSMNKIFAHDSQSFKAGFMTGLLVGSLIITLLFKIMLYFYEFLTLLLGNRRDRLLVACYDQLHPFEAKASAPANT